MLGPPYSGPVFGCCLVTGLKGLWVGVRAVPPGGLERTWPVPAQGHGDRSSATRSAGLESEFRPLLWERLQSQRHLRSALSMEPRRHLSRRAFSEMAEEAREIEAFLDEAGAWSNATFLPLIETTSTLRGLAIAGHTAQSILSSLDGKLPEPDLALAPEFREETERTLELVEDWLTHLVKAFQKHVQAIFGRSMPSEGPLPATSAPAWRPRLRLPADISLDSGPRVRRHVVEVVSKFMAHKKTLERQSSGKRFEDPEERKRFVKETCDEQQCRFFETRVQTLLAHYDNFVKGSTLEEEDPDLPVVRGYIGITRALTRILTELVHFWERHEGAVPSEELAEEIMGIVGPDQVLDRALNYALYYAHAFMGAATPVIERLVTRYVTVSQVVCALPDAVTLHIRPVSLISKIVDHHRAPVYMTIGKSTCFAGSIVQMLMAAGANFDAREVRFEGDQRVLDDIKLLFEHGLGESSEALPPELDYLRNENPTPET